MPNAGAQSLWLTGSRFYFQRDPIYVNGSPIVQPILDFGTVTPMTPAFTPTPVTLEDSDGGFLHIIAEQTTKMEEMYEVKCNNLNIDNLTLAFMASPAVPYDPAGDGLTTGQASTSLTGIIMQGTPGRLLKIADAAGNPVFGITSIDAIHVGTSGGTALTPYNASNGSGDYQVVSLERGLVRMLSTSTNFNTSGPLAVNYTPRAVIGNRTIYPQTQTCTSTGLGILVWGRCNNAEQSARVARFSVTPTTNTFEVSKYSEIGFRLRVLYDPTLTVNPAGHLSYWLGSLPSLS